jgi:hypothetical protein
MRKVRWISLLERVGVGLIFVGRRRSGPPPVYLSFQSFSMDVHVYFMGTGSLGVVISRALREKSNFDWCGWLRSVQLPFPPSLHTQQRHLYIESSR